MKLSIVTINFNDFKGLQKTFESVVNQSYKNIEYIIIDGASTDGTKPFLEQNTDKINYWISEKDSGIYNAMNKGVRAATGTYILFLNSGDCLIDHTVIEKFCMQLQTDKSFVYGNLVYSIDGTPTQLWTPPAKLSFSYFLNYSLPHPATFIKRNLFEKYGLYNETLKIISDWEFFLVCISKHNENYQHIDFTVADFDNSGVSSQKENLIKIDIEKHIVLQKHFPQFENDIQMFKEIDTKRFKQYICLKNHKFSWKLLKGFMNILLLLFSSKNLTKHTNYYQKIT